MSADTLDIRQLPKGRRLADLSERFKALPVLGSLIVTGGCRELDELRTDVRARLVRSLRVAAGLVRATGIAGPRLKTASAMLPRVLADTASVPATARAGAVWTLQPGDRQLDANIIHLPPGDRIDAPTGSDLDVLMIVIRGGGDLDTETGAVSIEPGQLAWLPRGSGRSIIAGPDGLNYLTVHTRRPPMTIGRRELGDLNATDRCRIARVPRWDAGASRVEGATVGVSQEQRAIGRFGCVTGDGPPVRGRG